MANRIFYAVQAVGIAPEDTSDYVFVHGAQSLGITTTFNLEQVFELGQLAIYENVENIPDIEVTVEKVLDGYPLLYHLTTRGYNTGTLVGRSNQKCNVAVNIYDDTQNSASGTPTSQVLMSGMFLSSISYTLPVEGNCTESVTLVGNNKVWNTTGITQFLGIHSDDTDQPLALTSGDGGVQRRENVKFDTGGGAGTYTKLPTEIPGISSSGTNNTTGGVFDAHVQTITISTDLGRTELNELGRKGPYFRYVEFPVEVTCDIEVTSTQGDLIEGTEAGVAGDGNNLTNQEIFVVLDDSTKIDLGSVNKLSNVTYGGGDAGGGNVSVTYSYVTFNDLTVTHDQDPT